AWGWPKFGRLSKAGVAPTNRSPRCHTGLGGDFRRSSSGSRTPPAIWASGRPHKGAAARAWPDVKPNRRRVVSLFWDSSVSFLGRRFDSIADARRNIGLAQSAQFRPLGGQHAS